MTTQAPHDCQFNEVEIGEADASGPLAAGMRVLVPCSCGDTAHDHLQLLDGELKRVSDALLASDPRRALFHWSPTRRRKQIIRYGLRPYMRVTVSTGLENFRASCVCLGDSPSWAWALSGEMSWAPAGSWDLWQTTLDLLTDPIVLGSEDRSSGIHEVRATHRIYKRDLWYVGSRIKEPHA